MGDKYVAKMKKRSVFCWIVVVFLVISIIKTGKAPIEKMIFTTATTMKKIL